MIFFYCRDALSKAQRTTERLANISKEVLKVFDIVNPKDHKKYASQLLFFFSLPAYQTKHNLIKHLIATFC